MAEKDVIYGLELLHAVQIKRECLGFATYVSKIAKDKKFKDLTKLEKDKLWAKYLKT